MTSIRHRQLAAGAALLFGVAAAGCGLPPGGEPPDGDLVVDVTSEKSICQDDDCNGQIVFTVTNPEGNPPTTEAPFPTVEPDQGTAVRDVGQSTCDDGPLAPGESCEETFNIEDSGGALSGTISVDAGNLEGGTTF